MDYTVAAAWQALADALNALERAQEDPSPSVRGGNGPSIVGHAGRVRWDADKATWVAEETY